MKTRLTMAIAAAAILAGCASGPEPYREAARDGAEGYSSLAIESDRFRVSYRADDPVVAREYALLRAAELTGEQGGDWFRVVSAYTDAQGPRGSGGTSVSVGGSTGSYGSGVGVGVGIGLGGGRDEDVVHVLEIMTGTGPTPDDPDVYDASAVIASLMPAR